MKVFTGIGIAVVVLAVLGVFNVGHFRLYYGPAVVCTPMDDAS